MKRSTWFCLILLILCLPKVQAADVFDLANPAFAHVGEDSNVIVAKAIAQSPSGMIYISAQKTIYSYDGYNFEPLSYIDETGELSQARFGSSRELSFDSNGDLWAVTLLGGLLHYNVKTRELVRYTHESDIERRISSTYLFDLLLHKNQVWIATNRGMDRLDRDSGIISRNVITLEGLSQRSVYAVTVDKDDRIWVAVDELGVYYTEDLGESWQRPEFADNTDAQKITTVLRLYVDAKNTVWVASYANSLFRIKNKKIHLINGAVSNYRSVAEPFENEVWVTSAEKGIQVYDLNTGEFKRDHRHDPFKKESISMDNLGPMFVDESGLLWIGTQGKGINTLNTKAIAYRSLTPSATDANSINTQNVRDILVRKNGHIWLSDSSYGIDVIDPSKGVIQTFPHKKGNKFGLKRKPSWLEETPDGKVMVGNIIGPPQLFDEAEQKFLNIKELELEPFGSGYQSISNSYGEILMSRGPPVRYEPRSNQLETISLGHDEDKYKGDSFFGATTDNKDGFWISGLKFLYYIPKRGKEGVRAKIINEVGLPVKLSKILQILWSRRNLLYIRTREHFYEAIPNIDNTELKLKKVIDGGFNNSFMETEDLWLYGVAEHLNPISGEHLNVRYIYGQAKMGPWSTSPISTELNTFIYKTANGIHLFKPDLFERWDYQPQMAITEITVDNQQFSPLLDKIDIAPEQDRVQLRFSSLDYSSPKNNQYRFRLHGYDTQWQLKDAGARFATYNNLAPGDYTLEVQGTNRVGDWSPKTKLIKITVLLDWYQTWWMKCLFSFVLAIFLYTIYRLRVRQLKAREVQLKSMVEIKTQDLFRSLTHLKEMQAKLVASEKHASLGRLIRGISHELNTPLGVIKMSFSILHDKVYNLFDSLDGQSLTLEELEKTKVQVGKVSEMLDKNLNRTIGLMASFKRVNVDENQTEMQWFEVRGAISEAAKLLGVGLDLDVDPGVKIYNDNKVFIDVITEILKNSQHQHKNKEDKIQIILDTYDVEGNQLVIKVIDSGPGVEDQYLKSIFDPFFTIGNSTSSVGLGLHIVHNNLTQHLNGAVRAENSDTLGLIMIIDLCVNNSTGHSGIASLP